MHYLLLFWAVARPRILLLVTLAVGGSCIAAELPLSLEEALRLAARDSSLLAAQRSAIHAAQESRQRFR